MSFSNKHRTALRALCFIASLGFAAHAQAVTVDIQLTKSWSSGYTANMVITNDGPAVSGWTLGLTLGHGIKSLSRATLTGSDPYTITSLSYSASMASGGSQTLGYTGAAAFSSSGLKNCVFNGQACTLLVDGKAIGGSTSSAASSSKSSAISSSSSAAAASSSAKSSAASSSSQPASSSSSSKAAASSSSGPTLSISGAVVDSANGVKIPYALIAYPSGSSTSYVRADNSGNYSLSVAKGSSVNVIARNYVANTYTVPTSTNNLMLSKEVLPAGVIFSDHFDSLTPGLYTDKKAFAAHMGVAWANGFIKTGDSQQTTNRVSADTSTYIGTSGASVKILYPKGANDSKPSGAQWQNMLDKAGSYKDLYFSYWVKPQAGADFGLGGKLPGIGGALSGNPKEIEWSGKLMWRRNGSVAAGLEFYMHVPGSPEETSFLWNYTGTQAQLVPGEWNHIQVHYKLNSPGKADGWMEGWLNGELRGKKTDMKFSGATTDIMAIDYFFFSTFYGGDATYAPKSDQYMWFDEIRVSNSYLPYSASTPKK